MQGCKNWMYKMRRFVPVMRFKARVAKCLHEVALSLRHDRPDRHTGWRSGDANV